MTRTGTPEALVYAPITCGKANCKSEAAAMVSGFDGVDCAQQGKTAKFKKMATATIVCKQPLTFVSKNRLILVTIGVFADRFAREDIVFGKKQ